MGSDHIDATVVVIPMRLGKLSGMFLVFPAQIGEVRWADNQRVNHVGRRNGKG
jgi:hypothetical protein